MNNPDTLESKGDFSIIKKKDGRDYTVRHNRDRYFYPDQWVKFYDLLKRANQKFTFDLLLATGARINEVRHIKVEDIDFDRNTIILRVTKTKAAKGEKHSRPRTIGISTQAAKALKKWIRDNDLKIGDYLGVLSTPAANICMKKTLREAGINDWRMFAVHSVRKTHGNWLKALGVEANEICLRLGHDYNTFLRSYGSPDVFNLKDLQNIRFLIGDLYMGRQR
jgi:integrase